jgi:predicted metalloprotease with PDZ domain
MGKLPSKIGALAQISTPLTHELFHLWVPNALALEGDYDWFYEGFTVYQAARTAVRLDLLTFQEFLDAIARAHDAANTQTNSVSLIEASSRRWSTGQAAVYSKSMVVAFLFDLRMRSLSHGKKSLDSVYRVILQKHSGNAAKFDGNQAVTQALAVDKASEDFVHQFIRRPVTINLGSELAPFGFEVGTFGLRTRIAVSDKLNKQQRDLLRELGYNDAVRSPRK